MSLDTPEAVEAEEVVVAETDEAKVSEESEDSPKKEANRQGFQERAKTRRLREENQTLQARLDAIEAAKSQPAVDAPDRDDYSDYEQYLEARADWRAETKFSELQAKADAQHAQRERQAQERSIETRWSDSADAAREKYEDFDDVAFGEVNITPEMSLAIKDSGDGGELAYYLGKHPDEADRIAKLSPLGQIRAIGTVEEKLKAKAAKPAPPTPINRGRTSQSTATNTLNDSMSTKDWIAARNKQLGR
jgi:hypothetical protein